MPGTRSITHASLRSWLRYQFFEKKLNTVFGYIVLSVIGVIMVYNTVLQNMMAGPATIAVIAGIGMTIAVLKYPYFGFYFLFVFSAFPTTIDRIINLGFPSGFLVEFFTYLLLFRIMLKYELKKSVDGRFWTNPITILFYIQFAYYLIELLNPAMYSQLGWFSYFRKQLSFMVFFYMAYSLLNTRAHVIYFVHFMIGLSTFCALYACKQQWFGYADFEKRWIGTGDGLTLLLQAGVLRKFSLFSDPATAGILFASITMLCVILLLRNAAPKKKWTLWFATVINVLGYSFSGTRTATLMLVAGIAVYVLATMNEKRSVYFLLGAVGMLVALMILPFKTSITARILSTFDGTTDLSAAVRDFDRKQVQPYIQDHPLGGGVFTCGAEGPKYNPGHPLEKLQPDSGYMKILAEQGAIGLILLLVFYFVVLQYGMRRFFHSRDPRIQSYYVALTMMLFTLIVAQYSQMAIAQYPVTLMFQGVLVVLMRLSAFDKPPKTESESEPVLINE